MYININWLWIVVSLHDASGDLHDELALQTRDMLEMKCWLLKPWMFNASVKSHQSADHHVVFNCIPTHFFWQTNLCLNQINIDPIHKWSHKQWCSQRLALSIASTCLSSLQTATMSFVLGFYTVSAEPPFLLDLLYKYNDTPHSAGHSMKRMACDTRIT